MGRGKGVHLMYPLKKIFIMTVHLPVSTTITYLFAKSFETKDQNLQCRVEEMLVSRNS